MSKEIDDLIGVYDSDPAKFSDYESILFTELKSLKAIEVNLVDAMKTTQDQFLENLTKLKGEFTKNKGAIEAVQRILLRHGNPKVKDGTIKDNNISTKNSKT